ncbi:Longitudinals lacking protein-like [Caligus rogercresseyi]|uniref:Longitudinals lacking protein-like n=1 Tax=Caligus rogercresseyi TaxID=217165 RepID=A0A7T8K9R1_CALRO|nr:Longitudinals lacking protein-like [Caligus rogercresseyi]
MCDYTSPRRDTMRSHVEAMHIITDGFECSICGKTYKTRNSLKTHKYERISETPSCTL